MHDILLVLPLIVILVLLLPPFRLHPILAGLIGGVLAMIVGPLAIGDATSAFASGTVQLLGIAPVIIFAATAITLARAGSMAAAMNLTKRVGRGRIEFIAPAMVIVQALATYASGSGASNLLVTGPLVFTTIGFIPAVVAAMGMASAAAWSVSPAAAETALIAEAMNMEIVDYVAFMRPYSMIIWIVAAILAYIGARLAVKKGLVRPNEAPAGAEAEFKTQTDQQLLGDPTTPDWKRMTPFVVLLILILSSATINKALGFPALSLLTIPIIVLGLAAVLIRIKPNDLAREFVESSRVILGLLLMVGVFLGFINMLTKIGTFEVIARLPGGLPVSLLSVAALVIAFLIAIPSGSYTAAVLAFLVPVFQAIGLPSEWFGFLTMMVAMGAIMSPVQVSVSALAIGFRTSIMKIVSNNARYQPFAAILVIILAVIGLTVLR